ncbi:hypothetical protein ACWDTB_23495, partial [Streptomyces sp. NPDC003487]
MPRAAACRVLPDRGPRISARGSRPGDRQRESGGTRCAGFVGGRAAALRTGPPGAQGPRPRRIAGRRVLLLEKAELPRYKT